MQEARDVTVGVTDRVNAEIISGLGRKAKKSLPGTQSRHIRRTAGGGSERVESAHGSTRRRGFR